MNKFWHAPSPHANVISLTTVPISHEVYSDSPFYRLWAWYLHFLETLLENYPIGLSLTLTPDVGLEPTATSLKGWRSTDWANRVRGATPI